MASGDDISAFFDGWSSRGRRWCGRPTPPPPAHLPPTWEQEVGEAEPALDRRTLIRSSLLMSKTAGGTGGKPGRRRPPKARLQTPGSPSTTCSEPTPSGLRPRHPHGGGLLPAVLYVAATEDHRPLHGGASAPHRAVCPGPPAIFKRMSSAAAGEQGSGVLLHPPPARREDPRRGLVCRMCAPSTAAGAYPTHASGPSSSDPAQPASWRCTRTTSATTATRSRGRAVAEGRHPPPLRGRRSPRWHRRWRRMELVCFLLSLPALVKPSRASPGVRSDHSPDRPAGCLPGGPSNAVLGTAVEKGEQQPAAAPFYMPSVMSSCRRLL